MNVVPCSLIVSPPCACTYRGPGGSRPLVLLVTVCRMRSDPVGARTTGRKSHGHPAVDRGRGAGHEGVVLAGVESDRLGDVARVCQAAQGGSGHLPLLE